MTTAKIIAIGGGGFTHDQDPVLENFIVNQCTRKQPKIGYIGNANGDISLRIDRFYKRFSSFDATLSHLLETDFKDNANAWIKQQDIIYVGGGHTANMLDTWFETSVADALRQAAESGAILCGVSAGAVCWYDHALSDSSGILAPLTALGLLKGSCCPHYSTEPLRQIAFSEHIAKGLISDGIAIDDGVAVLTSSNGSVTAFSARKGAGAYYVKKQNNTAITTSIPILNLGK